MCSSLERPTVKAAYGSSVVLVGAANTNTRWAVRENNTCTRLKTCTILRFSLIKRAHRRTLFEGLCSWWAGWAKSRFDLSLIIFDISQDVRCLQIFRSYVKSLNLYFEKIGASLEITNSVSAT